MLPATVVAAGAGLAVPAAVDGVQLCRLCPFTEEAGRGDLELDALDMGTGRAGDSEALGMGTGRAADTEDLIALTLGVW